MAEKPTRDQVLLRMLKTPPKPRAPLNKDLEKPTVEPRQKRTGKPRGDRRV